MNGSGSEVKLALFQQTESQLRIFGARWLVRISLLKFGGYIAHRTAIGFNFTD
jgi:hypothetical protein